MSTAPRGMSIQEAYRLYRDDSLVVNRAYQRKLVWTESEKARLIDSILNGFPIPLILLAERPRVEGVGKYEIVDGLQRLNAIFSYIENAFLLDTEYFDLDQFSRAKQIAASGLFSEYSGIGRKLSAQKCSDLLDYQLAVTIYKPSKDNEVTDVFGRINSGGRQLSDQDKRQAGVLTPFATFVRQLSAAIRGDTSNEVLLLSAMPEISIDSKRARQNYGLTAEDTLWCHLGILNNSDLRDGEDEEIIADLASSILMNEPLARSRESLDEIYKPGAELHGKVETALAVYGSAKLTGEMQGTISLMRELVEGHSQEKNALRRIVNPGSANPIKAAFYSIFMAFFHLSVSEQKSPAEPANIIEALRNLQNQLVRSAHYASPDDRRKNTDKTTGLIQRYFVKKDPPAFSHGPGLALDLENSLRRSGIETSRYECKQGLLNLGQQRNLNEGMLLRLPEIICSIANIGPETDGFVYLGVADKSEDAERIRVLDGISPLKVGQRFVVGINRELSPLNITLEVYLQKIVDCIRNSSLSDPLRMGVLSAVDAIDYRGLTIVRILVPKQGEVSFVGDDAFIRENSSTIRVQGKRLLDLQRPFKHS